MKYLQPLCHWRRQHPSLRPKQQNRLYHRAIELRQDGRLRPLPLYHLTDMAPHLPHLPDVLEDCWTVIVQLVQRPPEVLEHFYSLNTLCSFLHCEAKGRPQALVRNLHIPSLPPHLSVLVTSRRPLVFDERPYGLCILHKSQWGSGSTPH